MIIVLTGAAVAAGCSDGGTAATDGLCGQGVAVTYGGEDYCVYAQPIIETGFTCPPDFHHAGDGPGFVICGPGTGLDEGATGVVGAIGGSGCYAPMLDVIVVVDGSSSMCDEQRALAGPLEALALDLQAVGGDIRFAVTTPDLACEPSEITTGGGRFNTAPATEFPPPCQLRHPHECFDDATCAETFGDDGGEWSCRHPNTEACLVNPNGSINSSCVRHCQTDEECVAATGDDRAVCQKPSGNAYDWGCMIPPPAATCPAEIQVGLRSWLGTNELDSAACLTTVGVNQEKCFKYEQGLGAAWAAIDPNGPNWFQSDDFLRPEANLMLVFVSDEDDCTVADGQEIDEDDYDTCALLGDTDAGGPLVPIAEMVQRFQLLKDGKTVIVGTISGDSLAEDPAAREAERQAYASSKTDAKTCFHQTSICDSALGKADYGARYFAFAEAFGDDGVVANICAADPYADFISRLVARVTQIPAEVCHPR